MKKDIKMTETEDKRLTARERKEILTDADGFIRYVPQKPIWTEEEMKTERKVKGWVYPEYIVGFTRSCFIAGPKEDWVIKGNNFRLEWIEEMSFKLTFYNTESWNGVEIRLETDQLVDLLETFMGATLDGTITEWMKECWGANENIRYCFYHYPEGKREEETAKEIKRFEEELEEDLPGSKSLKEYKE